MLLGLPLVVLQDLALVAAVPQPVLGRYSFVPGLHGRWPHRPTALVRPPTIFPVLQVSILGNLRSVLHLTTLQRTMDQRVVSFAAPRLPLSRPQLVPDPFSVRRS